MRSAATRPHWGNSARAAYELAAERSAIAEFLSGAGAKRRELQSTRTEISARCRTLGDLVEKGARREDLVRAIADDEAALVAARTRAETETQAATDDRRAGDEQRDKARELRSRIDTLETALGGVELRGEGTWGDAEIDGPGAEWPPRRSNASSLSV